MSIGLYVCVCTTYVPDACGGQKTMTHNEELECWVTLSHNVGPGKLALVFHKCSEYTYAQSHHSSSEEREFEQQQNKEASVTYLTQDSCPSKMTSFLCVIFLQLA